jgi:hypothetical protein
LKGQTDINTANAGKKGQSLDDRVMRKDSEVKVKEKDMSFT